MVVSNGGVDGGVECGCGGCINLEKNETRSRYTIIEMQFGTTFTFIFGTILSFHLFHVLFFNLGGVGGVI